MGDIKYRFTPSRLNDYYKHVCDRFLVYDGLNNKERKNLGWNEKIDTDRSKRLAGDKWEEDALILLKKAGKNIAISSAKDKKWSKEETIQLLKKGETGYIYQGALYPTDALKEALLGEDADFLQWSDSYPDLIEVSRDEEKDCPVFSVIDMKRAKRAKLSFKTQVTLYIRMLVSILEENDINGYVDTQTGYIWNYGKETPTPFAVRDVDCFVDTFFEKNLPTAIRAVKEVRNLPKKKKPCDYLDETLDYCMGKMCEWCGNFNHCKNWAKDHEPIMLLPGLTRSAQEYIRSDKTIPRKIADFQKHISIKDNKKELVDNSLFFKRMMKYSDNMLKALTAMGCGNRNFACPNDVNVMDMPKYQDVCIILTAQKDDNADAVYLYGIRVSFTKKDINPLNFELNKVGRPEYSKIFIAKTPEDTDRITKEFADDLYRILKSIHEYNMTLAHKERLSLQGYVMDNYEYYNLRDTLTDHLIAETFGNGYTEKLLHLIFWMQGERTVTDVQASANSLGAEFPIVILSSAILRLYSIPGYIANNLEDISKALSENYNLDNTYHKNYSHPLSNTLNSDPINDIWDETLAGNTEKAEDKLKKLEGYMLRRMGIEEAILRSAQYGDKAHPGLKRSTPPFSLVTLDVSGDFRVRKLLMLQLYEELQEFHRIRGVRMQGLSESAKEGQLLCVSVEEEDFYEEFKRKFDSMTFNYVMVSGCMGRYRVLNSDSFFSDPYFIGMSTPATEEGARELAKVDERRFDILPDPLYPDISEIGNLEFHYEKKRVFLTGERLAGAPYEKGQILYITEYFNPIASNQAIAHLKKIRCINPLYPESSYRTTGYIYEKHKDLLETSARMDSFDFSDSQKKAFRHFFENNITLLLGPPGSGKTDFIARTLITICGFYKAIRNRNLSILVTANSHAAIDNILMKLAEKIAAGRGVIPEAAVPELVKLDRFSLASAQEGIDGICLMKKDDTYENDMLTEAGLKRILADFERDDEEEHPLIVGASPVGSFGLMKKNSFEGFDIVVADEASQLKVIDAFMALDSARTGGSRYLIVGDENQLPPIIAGKYRVDENVCNIYGSIFRMYYDLARLNPNLDYLCHLEDNFRMNEILDRYPGEKIYDADIKPGDGRNGYHAFNKAIGTQILSLDADPSDLDTEYGYPIGKILDPEYPMILIKLSGGSPQEKQQTELELVTDITKALNDHLLHEGKLCNTQEEFWGDASHKGVFGIISPHHEQINRLRDMICEELDMDRELLLIDTVDKLQGQEREAVCISYGISDVEKALGETEFIYSMNRLNVSITRGKKKMICILTDALLDRSIELLDIDDEDIQKGISFMSDLEKFMQRSENDTMNDIIEETIENVNMTIFRKRMR